jgi:hypothetical protein
MQYLAICEDTLLFNFMRKFATEQAEVFFVVQDSDAAKKIKRQGGRVRDGDLLRAETYKKIKLRHVDQAIVFLKDVERQERVCELLRALDGHIPILALVTDGDGQSGDPLVRRILVPDIFEEFFSTALIDIVKRKFIFYCSMIPTPTPSAAHWRCGNCSAETAPPPPLSPSARLPGPRTLR